MFLKHVLTEETGIFAGVGGEGEGGRGRNGWGGAGKEEGVAEGGCGERYMLSSIACDMQTCV